MDDQQRAKEFIPTDAIGNAYEFMGEEQVVPVCVAVEAITAALRAAPEGFVMVPVEMLETLADEAESGIHQTIFVPLKRQRHLSIVYQARELIAARPQGVKDA